MNKQQKAYAIRKAAYESASKNYLDYESDYMKGMGITRKSTKEDRDAAYDKFFADETEKELNNKFHTAMVDLHQAENDLIEYGLSIIPAGLAEKVKSGLHMHRTRQRFIDLTFNLDVKHGDQEVKEIMDNLYKQTA